MKITIIGSTGYQNKMISHKEKLEKEGHVVFIPVFDSQAQTYDTELKILSFNRSIIEIADEVHVFWDGRSTGTLFDFGMCYALRKKLKIIYLSKKSFVTAMEHYSIDCETLFR
jgi:hypothetical protein